MIEIIVIIALFFAGVIWLLTSGQNAGEDKAKREALENSADDVRTAKMARDRLDADADYLARVRDQFLRKK